MKRTAKRQPVAVKTLEEMTTEELTTLRQTLIDGLSNAPEVHPLLAKAIGDQIGLITAKLA
jgi:hypothetical protein